MIESHSDHVLNGVRRAIKKGSLEADDAALYFFRPRYEAVASGVAQVESRPSTPTATLTLGRRDFSISLTET